MFVNIDMCVVFASRPHVQIHETTHGKLRPPTLSSRRDPAYAAGVPGEVRQQSGGGWLSPPLGAPSGLLRGRLLTWRKKDFAWSQARSSSDKEPRLDSHSFEHKTIITPCTYTAYE